MLVNRTVKNLAHQQRSVWFKRQGPPSVISCLGFLGKAGLSWTLFRNDNGFQEGAHFNLTSYARERSEPWQVCCDILQLMQPDTPWVFPGPFQKGLNPNETLSSKQRLRSFTIYFACLLSPIISLIKF